MTTTDMFFAESEDDLTRDLCRYIRAVATAVGVPAHAWWCEITPPAEAYLALSERLTGFPDRDLALLWDEENGWSIALETSSGEDLIVLAYQATTLFPRPADVTRFLAATMVGDQPGRPDPPVLRRCAGRDELATCLQAAQRAHAATA